MRKIEIVTPIEVMSYDELDERDRILVDHARQSTYRSYAPYSKFSVGAAIELDNGEIVCGSNQENVAYPSGLCAERTAAFFAHSAHPDARFRTIAIAARGTDGEPVAAPIAPCGACRQSLLEYEMLAMENVRVLLVSATEIYVLPSVHSLLPVAFTDF